MGHGLHLCEPSAPRSPVSSPPSSWPSLAEDAAAAVAKPAPDHRGGALPGAVTSPHASLMAPPTGLGPLGGALTPLVLTGREAQVTPMATGLGQTPGRGPGGTLQAACLGSAPAEPCGSLRPFHDLSMAASSSVGAGRAARRSLLYESSVGQPGSVSVDCLTAAMAATYSEGDAVLTSLQPPPQPEPELAQADASLDGAADGGAAGNAGAGQGFGARAMELSHGGGPEFTDTEPAALPELLALWSDIVHDT
jgi:hypothetical protein